MSVKEYLDKKSEAEFIKRRIDSLKNLVRWN